MTYCEPESALQPQQSNGGKCSRSVRCLLGTQEATGLRVRIFKGHGPAAIGPNEAVLELRRVWVLDAVAVLLSIKLVSPAAQADLGKQNQLK